MQTGFNAIADYWRNNYSNPKEKNRKYENSEEFKKMVRLMAPGKSYYYIANFRSLEIEMISDSVCNFIEKESVPKTGIEFQEILALALPEEIEKIQRKEQVIREFFLEYLSPPEVLDYKVLYTYVIKDYKNNRKVMLHQASPISQDDQGHFVHVFSIHTDITHLTYQSVEEVSFLNICGGKSYLNIDTKSGRFSTKKQSKNTDMVALLSNRELEITKAFAEGLNAEEIAEKLFISSHTVKTHRKNILKKTYSKNTTQLVSRCISAGLIEPTL